MSTEIFVSVFTASDWLLVGICVAMVAAAFVVAFPSSSTAAEKRGRNLPHNQLPRR
jgi:hypothetical protein